MTTRGTGSKPVYRVSLTGRIVEPGKTIEYERFESLMKRLVSVPKKELDARREAERKRA
jgi:hypothetical protein